MRTGIVENMPILAKMIAQRKSFDFIFLRNLNIRTVTSSGLYILASAKWTTGPNAGIKQWIWICRVLSLPTSPLFSDAQITHCSSQGRRRGDAVQDVHPP
jgi:hypothetical protein